MLLETFVGCVAARVPSTPDWAFGEGQLLRESSTATPLETPGRSPVMGENGARD